LTLGNAEVARATGLEFLWGSLNQHTSIAWASSEQRFTLENLAVTLRTIVLET